MGTLCISNEQIKEYRKDFEKIGQETTECPLCKSKSKHKIDFEFYCIYMALRERYY